MPTRDDDADENRPKLQLETGGAGPGSVVRTAVGMFDGEALIDSSWLPDTPWWFSYVEKRFGPRCREKIGALPLATALVYLKQAGIPPISKLALGLQWGFLDSQSENFGRHDLKQLIADAGLGIDPKMQISPRDLANNPVLAEFKFEMVLRAIDHRALYRIWRYDASLKKIDQVN